MITRTEKWDLLANTVFDVAIVGGGINGASVYHHLCSKGYRVLLIDKGDFSSGTSQASAMMAWGGLLYLASLDLTTVLQLSDNREHLIQHLSRSVQPRRFRYVSQKSKAPIFSALFFYWLLGMCKRRMPYRDDSFSEAQFLSDRFSKGSLVYEEACLEHSDARFVLSWILGYQNESQIPLNYCALENASYDSHWHLELKDTLTGEETTTRAKLVINAAGVWTDLLNSQVHIETRYKHVFGKGVFIGFRRFEGHELPLIVDAGNCTETLSLIPWGPVTLWGPTETKLESIEAGFRVEPADVRFLLDRLNQHLRIPVCGSEIVSLRCGVRPLAVDRSYNAEERTLSISRRHHVVADQERPWISLYGGKITSCVALAEETANRVQQRVNASGSIAPPDSEPEEMCCTLEDYVRRRTNISQWIPRGGLGFKNEYRNDLLSIAMNLHHDATKAEEELNLYERKIKTEFDDVIASV